jgi:hypothetical protein
MYTFYWWRLVTNINYKYRSSPQRKLDCVIKEILSSSLRILWYIISKDLNKKKLTKEEYVDIINQYGKYVKIQHMPDRQFIDTVDQGPY